MDGHPGIDAVLEALGLDAPAAPESRHDGVVALRYGDGFVCVLALEVGGGVLASTPIAFVRKDTSHASLFESALSLNGEVEAIHSGVIGYDAVLSQLEYSTRFPRDTLDSGALPARFAGFLRAALGLRERFRALPLLSDAKGNGI